jgi:hypothetical protein
MGVSGVLLGRVDLESGSSSWTSPRSGLFLARWRGAGTERTVRIFVP